MSDAQQPLPFDEGPLGEAAPAEPEPQPVLKEKEEILIATPTGRSVVSAPLVEFCLRLQQLNYDTNCPWRFSFLFVCGVSPVEFARNRCVHFFLQAEGASRIWFWDDDMIPAPNALATLTVDADIVSGTYFNFGRVDYGGMGTIALIHPDYEPKTCKWSSLRDVQSPVMDIWGAGAGSMVVRRQVLADQRMHLPSSYTDIEGHPRDMNDEGGDTIAPAVFRSIYTPHGRVHASEDLDFIRRARLLGYSCKGLPGVFHGHQKTINLGDLAQFGQHLHARGAEYAAEKLGVLRNGRGIWPEQAPQVQKEV